VPAEAEIERIRKQLTKGNPADVARLEHDLAQAKKLEAAAKLKPVAGKLPLNRGRAGGTFGKAGLDLSNPEHVKAAEEMDRVGHGVHFNEHCYPDFEPWIYRESGDVTITLTGDRNLDFKRANEIMAKRYPGWKQPDGWTWHHVETVGSDLQDRLILVPTALHDRVKHTGGSAMYKHLTGDVNAYTKIRRGRKVAH